MDMWAGIQASLLLLLLSQVLIESLVNSMWKTSIFKKYFLCVLVRISIVVVKFQEQEQVKKQRVYFRLHSVRTPLLRVIRTGTQDRNPQTDTEAQGMELLADILLTTSLACFLIHTKTTNLGVATVTVRLALSHLIIN